MTKKSTRVTKKYTRNKFSDILMVKLILVLRYGTSNNRGVLNRVSEAG